MLQRITFAVSFMHLRLRRGCKKKRLISDEHLEKARQGPDCRIVQIICPLKGGHTFQEYHFCHFKCVLS